MANKKVALEVDVQSSGLDDTINKVDKLNSSIKQTELTTKDFGRNVKIEYDKAGNATDVLVDKELNLTKQIRAVKGQMEILTATGKAQSQEFTILQRKFNDLNDNLAKNKARSQELFGTLSLLPGPVGTFASSLQGGIDLLKTFSGVRLSDLKNQFKALGQDLKEIFKGFSEFNAKPIQTPQQPGTPTTPGGTTPVAPVVVQNNNEYLDTNTKLLFKNEEALMLNMKASERRRLSMKLQNDGQILATVTEGGYIEKTKMATLATEGLVVVEKEATFWTSTLGKTIKTVLISTGVLAAIVVIGELVGWMYKLATSQEDAEKAVKRFNITLEEQQRVLANDLTAIDAANKSSLTRAQIARKSEEELIKIQKEGNNNRLAALIVHDEDLYAQQISLAINTKIKGEEREKLQKDINDKILKSGQDVTKQILDNEQFRLDSELKLQDYYYSKRLSEIDAAIQLEIDKDVTNGETLAKLQKKRQDMVIAHDKMGLKQQELLRAQDKKKKIDAVNEDTQRIEAFQSKTEDMEIAAIEKTEKGKEEAELRARTKKLNQDILNLSYDKEFLKLSGEEKNKIYSDLNKTAEDDELKIRESYFLKRLQKIDEQKTLEIQKKKQQNDNLLALDQQYLIEGQDGIFGEALLHTKKYLEDRFVDMRSAAQIEHDSTDYQLTQELDQLKEAYDQKNLTQQEYESKVAETNKRIYENNQQLFDKNRQLDALEISAKKETAAATLQVAEAAVSVLSALSDQSEDMAIAAALADAGLGIAKIIISTQVAIAEFSASVAALGPVGVAMASAYAIKQKIAAGLGIAAITIGAIGKINSIKKGGTSGGTSGGGEDTINRGKNYGEGGMIDGPRHAQGGVPVNAEGGEAIMTRGAVTMFAPLLSMMNQAGGGVSFSKGAVGQANFDKPNTQSTPTEQPIIRTYVVENELTTTQHKAARLKSLSTL